MEKQSYKIPVQKGQTYHLEDEGLFISFRSQDVSGGKLDIAAGTYGQPTKTYRGLEIGDAVLYQAGDELVYEVRLLSLANTARILSESMAGAGGVEAIFLVTRLPGSSPGKQSG